MLTKQNVILSRLKKSGPLKVLCWPTHEGYQSLLGYLENVEFHMIKDPTGKGKTWDYHTRPLPPNHFNYLTDIQKTSLNFVPDVILSQERAIQLPTALSIGKQLGIPVIHIDHTEPYPNLTPKQFAKLSALKADYNVTISEHNAKTWGVENPIVIRHGINTDIFQGWSLDSVKTPQGCNISNLFVERDAFLDYNLFQKIEALHPCKVIGFNPSFPQYHNTINDPQILASTLASYAYYVNTTKLSPLPMSLLEAAAVGLPIVTTSHQEIGKWFKDGDNCLIANTLEEFDSAIKRILSNPEMASHIGRGARQTIIDNFSLQSFLQNWYNILESTRNYV